MGNLCACGCGEYTKRDSSRFCPGHASRSPRVKALLKRPLSWAHKENLCKAALGKKKSKESIEKRKATLAKTGYAYMKTKEYRDKMSKAMKNVRKPPSHSVKLREIMKNRNYNNYRRGFFDTHKATSGRIFFRSYLELLACVVLDNCEKVHSFGSEPFVIKYWYGGIYKVYIPDFIVNNNIIIEVKPTCDLNLPVNQHKFRYAEEYCKSSGMRFVVWTDELLYDVMEKQGELLGHLSSILLEYGYQHPSPPNGYKIVGGKVQRLISEDTQTNNLDTSALL